MFTFISLFCEILHGELFCSSLHVQKCPWTSIKTAAQQPECNWIYNCIWIKIAFSTVLLSIHPGSVDEGGGILWRNWKLDGGNPVELKIAANCVYYAEFYTKQNENTWTASAPGGGSGKHPSKQNFGTFSNKSAAIGPIGWDSPRPLRVNNSYWVGTACLPVLPIMSLSYLDYFELLHCFGFAQRVIWWSWGLHKRVWKILSECGCFPWMGNLPAGWHLRPVLYRGVWRTETIWSLWLQRESGETVSGDLMQDWQQCSWLRRTVTLLVLCFGNGATALLKSTYYACRKSLAVILGWAGKDLFLNPWRASASLVLNSVDQRYFSIKQLCVLSAVYL